MLQESPLTEPEVVELCLSVWNTKPESIEHPGGVGRKTLVVRIKGQNHVISKRSSKNRAKLEAMTLKKLASTGAVPSGRIFSDQFVIQDYVEGDRLTQKLELGDDKTREKWLTLAGKTLVKLQAAGRESGLKNLAPKIGSRSGWHTEFATSPIRLADQLGVARPKVEIEAIASRLHTNQSAFVKWDARPGNALVSPQGSVIWIDWEHCGIGSLEDDLVWLLADEWSPISPVSEENLLHHLGSVSGISTDEITYRFRTKAILHSTIRLGLIYRRKGDGPWWNPRTAMQFDRVGVTFAHVRRVCQRAAAWSRETKGFGDIAGFLESLAD